MPHNMLTGATIKVKLFEIFLRSLLARQSYSLKFVSRIVLHSATVPREHTYLVFHLFSPSSTSTSTSTSAASLSIRHSAN